METLSRTTIGVLRDGGWVPERRAQTMQWRTQIEGEGFVFHEAAGEFLEQFGSEPSPVGESTWACIFALDDCRILRFNIEMHRYCTYRNTFEFLNATLDPSFARLTRFQDVPRDLIPRGC